MLASKATRERAALSDLARRLGLSYRPGSAPGRGGELNGIVRGHRVLVRADVPALYVEYRFRVQGLRLSTLAPRRGKMPHGTLAGCDAAFERAFPLRAAPGAAGEALRGATAFQAQAVALARRRRRQWARLDFDAVQCTLTLWRRGLLARLLGGPAVALGLVEGLLPDVLSLVDALEAALREHALRTAVRAR